MNDVLWYLNALLMLFYRGRCVFYKLLSFLKICHFNFLHLHLRDFKIKRFSSTVIGSNGVDRPLKFILKFRTGNDVVHS